MPRFNVYDFGTCLSFNGSSSKVIVSDNSTLEGMANVSISFRFKMGVPFSGSSRKLFYKDNVYDIGFTSSGSIFAEIVGVKNLGIINSVNYVDNKWHHFVITYNGANCVAYMDGSQIATDSVVGAPSVATSSANLGFGQHVQNGNEWFLGLMDDVRIYNRALSATEVSDFYYCIEPSTTGLVSWWKFDEGSGTSAADSIGSNTGTITNATYSTDVFIKPRTSAGQRQVVRDFGTCLRFSVADSRVVFTDSTSLDIANTITISAWIKPSSYGESSQGRIVDKLNTTNGYALMLNNASSVGGLRAFVSGTARTSNNNVIKLGVWQHVALTYDKDAGANNLIFYVNGLAQGTATETGAIANTTSNLTIGSNALIQDRDFNGLIDEVKIYNRALSSTEIQNEYLGKNNSTSGLVLYAKFDEGSGSSATDSSGSQSAGTITGATYSTDVPIKLRTAA